jgi:hypothetical protein
MDLLLAGRLEELLHRQPLAIASGSGMTARHSVSRACRAARRLRVVERDSAPHLRLRHVGAAGIRRSGQDQPADVSDRRPRHLVSERQPPDRWLSAAAGSVLLEDGTKDEVVPHSALLNIVHAAPSGTTVHWYKAKHALDNAAYHDAFVWLAGKLPVDGPRVPGAVTESTAHR